MGRASRRKRERKARPEAVSVLGGELQARPTEADSAADLRAIEADRAFFEANPNATRYRRPPVPRGLRYSIPPASDLVAVEVTEIKPGTRLRVPVFQPLAALEIN